MAKWERCIVYPMLLVALFSRVAHETPMLHAAGEKIIEEVRAKRVVVVDDDGREQVVLTYAQAEAAEDEDTELAELRRRLCAMSRAGGRIMIFDSEGEQRVYLRADGHDGGLLWLHGGDLSLCGPIGMGLSADEWYALYLTARQNTVDALTKKLQQASFTVTVSRRTREDGVALEVMVDTKCQPDWDFYVGMGRFSVSDREVRAAYEEAGNVVFERIRLVFPRVSMNQVEIEFSIRGFEVGTWRNGIMKLVGEK